MNASRTIVVGGTSRLGRALRARSAGLRSISRRPDPTGGVSTTVNDYHAITPGMLADADAVVHLVGSQIGSTNDLIETNASLALTVAAAAKEAGVRRFVYISSFSVYGARQWITGDTPTDPDSDYGKSKLRAEQLLTSLRSDAFEPVSIRLPSLYDADSGKLHQLVAAGTRWRLFPQPDKGVQRSFLSYDNAARLLMDIASAPPGDIPSAPFAAADPEPFDFHTARDVIGAATDRKIRLIHIPFAERAIGLLAPKLRASVFDSSVLDIRANAAAHLASTLYGDVAAIAKRTAAIA